MRKAEVVMHNQPAGWLTQDENGYHFVYDKNIFGQKEIRNDTITFVYIK